MFPSSLSNSLTSCFSTSERNRLNADSILCRLSGSLLIFEDACQEPVKSPVSPPMNTPPAEKNKIAKMSPRGVGFRRGVTSGIGSVPIPRSQQERDQPASSNRSKRDGSNAPVRPSANCTIVGLSCALNALNAANLPRLTRHASASPRPSPINVPIVACEVSVLAAELRVSRSDC